MQQQMIDMVVLWDQSSVPAVDGSSSSRSRSRSASRENVKESVEERRVCHAVLVVRRVHAVKDRYVQSITL